MLWKALRIMKAIRPNISIQTGTMMIRLATMLCPQIANARLRKLSEYNQEFCCIDERGKFLKLYSPKTRESKDSEETDVTDETFSAERILGFLGYVGCLGFVYEQPLVAPQSKQTSHAPFRFILKLPQPLHIDPV